MRRLLALLLVSTISSCGSSQQQPTQSDEVAQEPASTESEAAPVDAVAQTAAPAATQECSLAQGAVRLLVPVAEGFQLRGGGGEEACRLFDGESPMAARVLVQLFAIPASDAGPEQLLSGEPDGARRWALATGVMGPSAEAVGEAPIVVGQEQASCYRIVGQPAGLEGPREVAVLRLRLGDLNVVMMAIYRPEESESREAAAALLSGISLAQ